MIRTVLLLTLAGASVLGQSPQNPNRAPPSLGTKNASPPAAMDQPMNGMPSGSAPQREGRPMDNPMIKQMMAMKQVAMMEKRSKTDHFHKKKQEAPMKKAVMMEQRSKTDQFLKTKQEAPMKKAKPSLWNSGQRQISSSRQNKRLP
eukprot:TRINITY_DN46_c0_g1_i16.p1 TRINITY_DN46_c0_g1~~TRINITY_DN46_c0_g1_i16.p1  ORF type:complete len:146 (+),score=32.58 TRINITY_DN46_c0_g1_i16:74-511(+)